MRAPVKAADDNSTKMTATMDDVSLRREVFRLTWPVVLQGSFRTIFFISDTAMLGHYSNAALATIGISGPLMHTLIVFLSALSVGTVAIVSRAVGERDEAKARRDGATALSSAGALGALGALLSWLLVPLFVSLFPVERGEIAAGATDYLRIVGCFLPVVTLELVAASILRAAGNTRAPMIAAAFANALNIALNALLIFGLRIGPVQFPELGVSGAALATGLAYMAEVLLLFAFLFSKRSPLRFSAREVFAFQWESLRKLARVSLPAAFEPIVVQSGFLVMAWMVTKLGEESLAAHRAAISIESLSFMPGFGFSLACAALVGQRLGAGSPDEASRAMKETAKLSVLIMSGIGLLFLLAPKLLMRLSTTDAAIIEVGAAALMIGALEQPTMAVGFVLQGLLRGAGDTKSPLLVAFIGVWLVRVPLGYFLAVTCGWGLAGIWWTTVVDWGVRALVLWVIYRRGVWRRIVL
jgi:putative MATE family efflux protein